MPTKPELRQMFLARRRALPADDWRDRSDCLCAALQQAPFWSQVNVVAGYFSTRNEPDLTELVATGNRRWAFPRCVGTALAWHFWATGEPLVRGAYGIREPEAIATVCAPEQVDVLLVPAVACDARGFRLGYGGGFYDRLLSLPEWQTVRAIGVTFEFAFVPELPADPWDRPLAGVCTEAGLRWCDRAV